MKDIYLYIAMTLDGFIADSNNSVSFLDEYNDCSELWDNYNSFIANIDSIVMGYNTYNQILNELSISVWPYDNFTSYVFTHREIESKKDNIKIVNDDLIKFIKELKTKATKGIWICGGANIINPLIKENLIDRYYITLIPKILGNGVRLFQDNNLLLKLNLVSTKVYDNGIIDLIYYSK